MEMFRKLGREALLAMGIALAGITGALAADRFERITPRAAGYDPGKLDALRAAQNVGYRMPGA